MEQDSITEGATDLRPAEAEQTTIVGVAFVSVYVDDFQTAYRFYSELLGLEKMYDMGENACFFKLGGDWGLYLEGGHPAQELPLKSSRSTFTLSVPSAGAMYRKLRDAGVRMVQEKPTDMGQGDFWFQIYDPSGNILEVLGGN